VSIAWGFGAAIVITFLPLFESQDEIGKVCSGILNYLLCKKGDAADYAEEEAEPVKEVDEPVVEPVKEVEGEEPAKAEEEA
jgi:hypothetical protein